MKRQTVLALSLLSLMITARSMAQGPIVNGPVATRLDSLLSAAESRGFHGSILVAQNGAVVLRRGYGLAIHEGKVRYSPGTLVQIGSNVKDFTKLAVFQLVEAGRLRLEDSLGKFVKDLSSEKSAITVQQLMQHTGGLPLTVAGDDFPLTREEMLKRLREVPLKSAPGSARSYSNLGYALLGLIIEQVSGQSYDQYVDRQILKSAGLTQTGSYLPRFDRARIAHGYSGEKDIGIILDQPHDKDGHLWSLRANGGYLSTLDDMYRFYQAVGGPDLLKEPQHRRLVFNAAEANVYAGSDLTSFFLFANFPKVATQVVMASNHSAFPANRLLRDIQNTLGVEQPGQRMVTTSQPAGNAAPGSTTLPDTGAAVTIGAYLQAFNSGSEDEMRQFFADHAVPGPESPPIETRLERYRAMRGNLGKLTFKSYAPAADGEGWAVRLDTENGDPATFTMALEKEAPYRLKGIRVEVGD